MSAKSASGGTKKKTLPELAGTSAVKALSELLGVPAPAPADSVPAPVKSRAKGVPMNGAH